MDFTEALIGFRPTRHFCRPRAVMPLHNVVLRKWCIGWLSTTRCKSPSLGRVGPRIDRLGASIAELPFITCDDRKVMMQRHAREHRIREMAIERFSPTALFFHDKGAGAGISNRPVEETIFEKIIQQSLKPLSKTLATLPGFEPADPVQDFPGGDGCKTDSLGGNPVEKLGHSRLRACAHHLGDDVRVQEPGSRSGHFRFSSGSATGL